MDNKSNRIFKVVQILNFGAKVVINGGRNFEIKNGDRFVVYCLSDDEIFDPDTGENLGKIEIIKGCGKATHTQETLTTISATTIPEGPTRKVIRKNSGAMAAITGVTTEEYVDSQPSFDEPSLNDLVRFLG